ncbi:MAG TPA: zeta toxin family protein [Bacteroidia bacterium]|nr:zeta toxin family protein [Bacteroidia bacterium]
MTKTIEIFAGPNGSGKTTFGEKGYAKRKDAIYLNPDKIASGLSVTGGEMSQFEAGRVLFKRVEDCLSQNISFAFETTMSGKIWISFIKKAKKRGYKISIYFLFVNSEKLSLKRIRNRVKLGGHDIPKETVHRRFEKTFSNFKTLYAPLADEWTLIDNSKRGKVIAKLEAGTIKVSNKATYKKFFQ